MLIRLTKAEHVIEIGVFTGFTTLGMVLARERPLGSQP
jgi:predicted O-methyltransferase YrrM